MLNADSAKMEIVPPFHKLDAFKDAEIDTALANELQDGNVNILSVGRLVPNKGHKHLIRVIAKYVEMYDANIRLNLVGGIDPELNAYADELGALIEVNGLQENVRITGPVSFDALHTYYQYSHLFLLMSSHEGFCLPVIEAQFHMLPIIALNRCAVSETMGPNQLMFEKLNYQTFAAAIHVLFNNLEYRCYLSSEGQKNIQRFVNKTIEKAFFNVLGIDTCTN